MDDRRKSLRWHGTLPCRLEQGEGGFTGQVVNLSFDGARIDDPSELPSLGSEIVVILRPERENVSMRARVVYVRQRQFGVEFCGSRTDHLEALKPFFQL